MVIIVLGCDIQQGILYNNIWGNFIYIVVYFFFLMFCVQGIYLICVFRVIMIFYIYFLINQFLKGKYKVFYLYVILIGCEWNFFVGFVQI